MPLDARNYYLIRAANGASVMCRRATDAPKLVSGGARYNVVNRARRKSTVQWDGDDPYRMDVPVLLDGWIQHVSVERDIAKLNNMRQSPGDLVPPVQVSIDGALPVKGARWVLEGIDWGDVVIWGSDTPNTMLSDFKGNGYRLRQDAVLHLLQVVTPSVLAITAASNSWVPIVMKAEQTMAGIAKEFGVTIPAILKANGMRDSKSIKTGQQINVPASIFNLPISNPFNLPVKIKK